MIWVEAVRARNLAVHVYREEMAKALAEQLVPLRAAFVELIDKLPAV